MNSSPQSLQSILEQFLKDKGWESAVKESQVPELWRSCIGERASLVSVFKRFEHGELIVEIQSTVWRTELRLRSEQIRKQMNELLEADIVQSIIIK